MALDSIKDYFYSGSYQSVINESNNSGFTSSLSSKEQVTCRVLLFRRFSLVLNELKSSSATSSNEMKLVRLLTLYLSNSSDAEGIISEAKTWIEQNSPLLASSADLCILLGTLMTLHGLYADAIKILVSCPRDLECAALQLQIFCLMNRPDLALDLVEYTKNWAGDPILVQMMDAWTGIYRGDAIKYEEAFYLFEELVATYPFSVKLLASKAVCLMHVKKFQEAEQVLLESISKNPNDVESLANLIVVALALDKGDAGQYVAQLQDISPSHFLIVKSTEMSNLFDECAAKFS